MTEDADLGQLAVLLLDLHGSRALEEAQQRASLALARGDLESHAMWLAALDYCHLPPDVLLCERVH